MSYVNKRSRLFLNRGLRVIRRRSETRLKQYASSVDARAWCDVVEDRRQHIIELVTKEIQKCTGKLIPIEVIVDALLASLNTDICKLKNCLLQLWKFVETINLNAEQKENVANMKQRMEITCKDALEGTERDCMAPRENKAIDASPGGMPAESSKGSGSYKVTSNAQARIITRVKGVQPEIQNGSLESNRPTIAGGGSYKVSTKAPGRVVTRIKGVRPGAQLISGKRIGTITTRAQHSSKVKTVFKNVYPDGRRGGRSRASDDDSSRTLFMDRGDMKLVKRRSEGRLKEYPSAIDARAWCDIVEDRRQHIIELINRGAEKCGGGLIPIEAILDVLLASKNADIAKLKRCLLQLWKFIEGINLSSDENVKLLSLKQKMDKTCTDALREPKTECVAKARHDRERTEVDALNKMVEDDLQGTYKVTADGPAKITTRIKGIKPGFEIAPGITSGTITTRAQGSSKLKVTIKDAYPHGKMDAVSGSSIKAEISVNEGMVNEVSSTRGTRQDATASRDVNISLTSIDQDKTKVAIEVSSEVNDSSKVLAASASVKQEIGPKILKTNLSGASEAMDTALSYDDPVDQINKMRDQLVAREALCNEQQITIENLKSERDDLKDRLDKCHQELENVKKLQGIGVGDMGVPLSCEEEISALEMEIKVMRSGHLSPEQEAEIIKKEVDVLRKYCLRLRSIEDENEKLKIERDDLKSQVAITDEPQKIKIERYGSKEKVSHMEELNNKLRNLEGITKERDALANKVEKLEKELLQYRDLPDDIDVYRDRSKMLDSALEERDKMNMKVEQMKDMENELNYLRKKAGRVDELEQELKFYSKNDTNANIDLKKTKSRCCYLEREMQNVKMERDTMVKRIEHMKREMDILKSRSKEAEILKLERDRLQIKLNELSHIQVEQENLLLKCKCLENAAKERDTYKQKYDEILSMECQCEVLRSQVDAARDLARERDGLVKQVRDLESCICEQEDEIKTLVSQIDDLNRNKDESQTRMKDALANMRAEVEKKDTLIAASEGKLAAVQSQLKSSIQGVSCETTCYKTRIEDLERELNKSQSKIKTLQKQLRDSHTSLKTTKQLTKNECDSVAAMKRELEVAKAENKKLQDIANKMVTLTGDEHVQKMLKQSECAVKRVVEELGKQYKEWDQFKSSQIKGKTCSCKCYLSDTTDSESNEKIRELEDIQREKEKLEKLVRDIQNNKLACGPQKELVSLRIENSNLQEQLQREMKQKRDLERMLNK